MDHPNIVAKKLSTDKKKRCQLLSYCQEADYLKVKKFCHDSGVSMSEFLREAALEKLEAA